MTQFGDYIEPKKKKVNRNAANEQTAYIRGNQPQPRQNENNPRDYDQNKVENGSGYNVDPFAVLRIHNATWADRTDGKFVNEGMRLGVESLGVKPSTEWDQVSVLQKSAPSGSFAQGVCSGPSPVFVLYRTRASLAYPFAIPLPEDSSKLIASPYGLNRILWHAPPSEGFQECTGEVLQTYVNLGEDGQWVFWKLENDLPCCGSTTAKLCDLCGTVLQPECPIIRPIYAPKGLNLCGCENSCGTWKAGDVVPAWWFQYLEKWVTIPNFQANFEEKEMEVVTGLQITGGTVRPTEDYKSVVTDITFDTRYITLCDHAPEPVTCLSGAIEFGDDAKATGSVTVTGTIGSAQSPIELEVTSQSDMVTIYDASITSSANLTLTGEMSGSASVTVPLSGVSLDVTGTCGGTADGAISVGGTANLSGSCRIWENLPTLIVNGSVGISGSANLSGTVNVAPGAATLSSSGAAKTLLKSVTIKKDSATAAAILVPPITGQITGSLSNSTTQQVSLSNLTITLDLSDFFEEVNAVDPSTFTFSGCTLDWLPMKVLKLKSGASLGSLTASLSGKLSIPSAVVCDFDHTSQASSYTLDTDSESVSIPDTVTLDSSKLTVSGTGTVSTTGTLTGSATWPEGAQLVGACNVNGPISAGGTASLVVTGTIAGAASGSAGATATGTATITDTVTVSGPLSIASGVYIRGQLIPDYPLKATGTIPNVSLSTAQDVELRLSGTIENNQICEVSVPHSLCFDEGWFDVDQDDVPFPGIDLTGATISGVTDTIKYVACADCPETEEGEEEE